MEQRTTISWTQVARATRKCPKTGALESVYVPPWLFVWNPWKGRP